MNVECGCWLCAGDDLAERGDHARNLAWHVQEHGWSVVAVSEERDVPGWTYTVGMWHTMGSPEVCMFGLRVRDMHSWVNAAGAQVRSGQPLRANELRQGVLSGFPVLVRPVHESWFPDLLCIASEFYGLPVPAMQLIWPDRHGRFPWEPGAGERCRVFQPRLWLPKDDHPPSLWTRLPELSESPFPDADIDELVVGSRRVINGEAPIAGIVHTEDGAWKFLDGHPTREVGMVHLRHLVSDHPYIRDFADLPRGHAAWQQPDGNWSRQPYPVD